MASNGVDLSHLLPDGNEKLGYGGFIAIQPPVINVFLIGCSQTGKTAIFEALKNPRVGMCRRGYSSTKEPTVYQVILNNENDMSKTCLLNICDTPGLHEIRKDGLSRKNSELFKLAERRLKEGNVDSKVVCFVSKAGEMNSADIAVFEKFKHHLGDQYSKCSMMILTHSDNFTEEKLLEFKLEIQKNKKTSDICRYCKLGIFFTGIADYDDLQTYQIEMQKSLFLKKLTLLEKYRKELLSAIISSKQVNEVVVKHRDRNNLSLPPSKRKREDAIRVNSSMRSAKPINETRL